MYHVILVDDEVLVRTAIQENMNWGEFGFELDGCFQHGREAIDFIRSNPVDLVMTDICMPYMDGLELSRVIKEEFPRIHVVILSGFDNFEYAQQAIKYKVSDYLLKPFSVTELSEVLQTMKDKLDEERREEYRLMRIRQSYRENKMLIRSQRLMKLICSSKTLEELNRDFDMFGISLSSSCYHVAILDTEIEETDKKDMELLFFSIYNIAEEIVRQARIGYVVQRMDYRVIILFAGDNPECALQDIRRVINRIGLEVMRCMGLKVIAGIGSFVSKVPDLDDSYEEAQHMLGFSYLVDGKGVFLYEDVAGVKPFTDWNRLQRTIQEALKGGQKEVLHHTFEDMLEQMRQSYVKWDCADVILQDILHETMDFLKNTSLMESDLFHEIEEAPLLIGRIKKLSGIMEVLENLYDRITDALKECKGKKGESRAAIAFDFIKNHYMEETLSLQSVCDYMAMSPSRFCAMFKDCTGNSFMEVLIGIRMEKAKELLETTDLKNYEIADRVGIGDPHYFSLSFKKATGKTPTEYAKEKRR